jgi:hypothetical protein
MVGLVGGRIWPRVCRTDGVRSRRKEVGLIEVKSWFVWVALRVAMRYITVLREEMWSSGPNGPYGIFAGRDCPVTSCVARTWAWISRLSTGERELRRRLRPKGVDPGWVWV